MENIKEFSYVEQDRPVLGAELRGGDEFPGLRGKVYVYVLPEGIYLQGDFENLPPSSTLGFHVHEGILCENKGERLLILPDIISDGEGAASMQIYLDKAVHTDIAGRPVVLHTHDPDNTIACGLLARIL